MGLTYTPFTLVARRRTLPLFQAWARDPARPRLRILLQYSAVVQQWQEVGQEENFPESLRFPWLKDVLPD